MNKIINYFFDEDELELVSMYSSLVKLAVVSAVISLILIIL